MRKLADASAAAIGFTVKSGWTVAVVLAGPVSSPRVVASRRIDLADPSNPDARQPYHAGFGTARAAGTELTRLVRDVKQGGRSALGAVIGEFQAAGPPLTRAGIVVGSLADPMTIRNDHIRIHALEGQLFREIVQAAVEAHGIECSVARERDLRQLAARCLKMSETALANAVLALRRDVDGPWRAEHKSAAVAAWMALGR